MDTLVPSIVIAAYAEPLLESRRVIVFGDATSSLAEHVLERGARVVHVYDQDPARAAAGSAKNRSRNVSIAPFGEDDVTVRDGAFDIAIIEDLAAAESAKDLLKRARRALSARGLAIVASANPDARLRLLGQRALHTGIGYYDLYDLVAAEFENVRMLGQAPFAGYAIVDFANDGDLDLSIDTSFVANGAEEPEWFIAIGSERPVELDAFAVIQLPLAELLPVREKEPDVEVRSLREQNEAVLGRMERLQAELRSASESFEESSRADKARFEAEVIGLRAQIAQKESWITELETRAATADARADETLDAVEREREKESERLAALQTRISELDEKNAQLGDQLREREQELEKLSSVEDGSSTADYALLEAELKARGAEVLELQKNLRDAVRTGLELAEELTRREVATPQVPSDIEADMAALTATNARLAADLAAARWTIQELEDRLQAVSGSPADRQAQARE